MSGNPTTQELACSGGKFVVSGAGEAYDARVRGPNRKSRLISPARYLCRKKASKPRPRSPLPIRVSVEGSGTVIVLDVPCIETKPKSNVEPNPVLPLKVISAGNVRLLICVPPRVVVAPLPPTIEHPLKNDVAPPLIWHWALLAIPVLFCPVLVSMKEKLLPMSLKTTYFCVPAPILLGWLRRTRRELRL